MATVWQLLADEIEAYGEPQLVAGGCINHCAILTVSGTGERVFAKTNSADKEEMFKAEAFSLMILAKTNTIRVPGVYRVGVVGEFSYLILEYIPMRSGSLRQFHVLGEKLAALHLQTTEDGPFGWRTDNFIGKTPQPNPSTPDWATFFGEHRIGYQLELARGRGKVFEHADRLLETIPKLLAGHEPKRSTLHGDLWSGNAGFCCDGHPLVFDPACYCGDRETDIAFTEMFGGFEPEFYSGYRSVFPLEDGYEQRRELYNLYHVLNHYKLFGGSYGEQAGAIIRKLLVGF